MIESGKCENSVKEQEGVKKHGIILCPTFWERVHIKIIKLVAFNKPLMIGQHISFLSRVTIHNGGYVADCKFEHEPSN